MSYTLILILAFPFLGVPHPTSTIVTTYQSESSCTTARNLVVAQAKEGMNVRVIVAACTAIR